MINIALARAFSRIRSPHRQLEAGLQFYNGALADPSSQYAQKVFAEKERLQQAVRQFGRPGCAARFDHRASREPFSIRAMLFTPSSRSASERV